MTLGKHKTFEYQRCVLVKMVIGRCLLLNYHKVTDLLVFRRKCFVVHDKFLMGGKNLNHN